MARHRETFGLKSEWKDFFTMYRHSLTGNDSDNPLVTITHIDGDNGVVLTVTIQVKPFDLTASLTLNKVGELLLSSHTHTTTNTTSTNSTKKRKVTDDVPDDFPDITFLDKPKRAACNSAGSDGGGDGSASDVAGLIHELVFGLYHSYRQRSSPATSTTSTTTASQLAASAKGDANQKEVLQLRQKIESLQSEVALLKQQNADGVNGSGSQSSSQSQTSDAVASQQARRAALMKDRSIINPGQRRREKRGIHFDD